MNKKQMKEAIRIRAESNQFAHKLCQCSVESSFGAVLTNSRALTSGQLAVQFQSNFERILINRRTNLTASKTRLG